MSSAPPRFPYGDAAKQQYAELRSSGPPDDLAVSLVSIRQDGQKRFNTLLNSDGTRNWVTPEELQRVIQTRSGSAPPRFPYGDATKQQYAELRTSGPNDNREMAVSLVSIQQDGKKRFNILLNTDGTRNWVTPEELKRLTERSGASKTALEAKVAELAEQIKQLQALHDSL